MNLGVAFVAGPEASEVVEVREAAFYDPALAPNAGAVLDAAPRDDGLDVAFPEQSAVLVVVIAAVGEHEIGLLTRPADLPRNGPAVQHVQQRQQLGDVVAVAAGQRDGEGNPGRVDQKMVL